MISKTSLKKSPLGKKVQYVDTYTPQLLFSIPRKEKRVEIGIFGQLPFKGVDVWNAYELSWLNAKGKPMVALGEFIIPCESPYLIESKSFKLYLNSFNQSKFTTLQEVVRLLTQDLSHAVGMPVKVKIDLVNVYPGATVENFTGCCIDDLDVECHIYQVEPAYLSFDGENEVSETLYSHLLKSNCLITGQPDWGSVQISYTGKKIDRRGLLKYLISFRSHNEFHEQCVERIFIDFLHHCRPTKLTVEARYTRRGGLDINPYRTTENTFPRNIRLFRQ